MELSSAKTDDAGDSTALLSSTSLSTTPNSKRQWSNTQLFVICGIVCIVAVLATNLDRIIAASKSNDSETASPFDSNKSFGHEMLDYFDLDEKYLYFNTGSHGIVPIYVKQAAQTLYDQIAECANCWFSFDRVNQLQAVLKLVAEYLGIADWTDLVFVDNASQGINTVLTSLSTRIWNEQCMGNTTCVVLRFSTSYPMVRNAVQWLDANIASRAPQEIVYDISLPELTNTTLLLQGLAAFIEHQHSLNHTIYLAFVSHIIFDPAVILDVAAITALFREYGIITCVDAAHAMGQIKLNLTAMDPDIYVADGYKWLYAPRGSAVMYVKKEFQHLMYPVVISTRNPFTTSFQERFDWLGLKDYVPYLAMKAALEFRQQIGEDAIIDYLHEMAMQGGRRVAEIWQTRLYVEEEEYVAGLVSVVLPNNNISGWDTSRVGNEYNLFLRVNTNNLFGDAVARFTTQIFHELIDFENAAYAVLDILNE